MLRIGLCRRGPHGAPGGVLLVCVGYLQHCTVSTGTPSYVKSGGKAHGGVHNTFALLLVWETYTLTWPKGRIRIPEPRSTSKLTDFAACCFTLFILATASTFATFAPTCFIPRAR